MQQRLVNIKNTVDRWEEEVATQGKKTALTEVDIKKMKMFIDRTEEAFKNVEEWLVLCEQFEDEAGY